MQEINLYHLLKYYVKHWLIVVLLTSIGLGIGIFYNTYMQVPQYKSEATLLLISPDLAASPQDTTLINNYIELFKSRRVLQPVIDQEKLNTSYDQFVGTVGAANDKTTQVIKVSITSKSPVVSRTSTDAAIVSFKSQVTTLYNTDNISVVDSASSPDLPYNIHKSTQLLLATAAGFILAVIGLFFVFDFKQDKEHDQSTGEVAPLNKASTAPTISDHQTIEAKQPQPALRKPRARKRTTPMKARFARLWAAIATRAREDWYRPDPVAAETPAPTISDHQTIEAKQPQPALRKPRARKPTTATKPWIARLWAAIATRAREDWSREEWYGPSPVAVETPAPKAKTAKNKTKNKK